MNDLLERYLSLRKDPASSGFRTRRVRDLLTTELLPGFYIVVACDSDGGIGPKEADTVHCPGYVLGRFAVRVPLMELLAAGVAPLLVIDVLTVEMDPTGKEIITGVRDEVAAAGLDADSVVTGSTEDNVPTVQTGVGVVVIGLVDESDFRPGSSRVGDIVVCVGKPKSAPDDDVQWSDRKIADVGCVRTLTGADFIHDILPVGSRGIMHEASEMAVSAGLKVSFVDDPAVDVNKSGGPSTCVLASLSADEIESLESMVGQPVFKIGVMR